MRLYYEPSSAPLYISAKRGLADTIQAVDLIGWGRWEPLGLWHGATSNIPEPHQRELFVPASIVNNRQSRVCTVHATRWNPLRNLIQLQIRHLLIADVTV